MFNRFFQRNVARGQDKMIRRVAVVPEQSFQILPLEPRFMFDAAGVATVAEHADKASLPDGASHPDRPAADGASSDTTAKVEVPALNDQGSGAAVSNADPQKKEAVFIESNLKDYQSLAAGVPSGVDVVILDAARDGLTQIAEWSASHSGYDAIHVISHGTEGRINLGTFALDSASADVRAGDLATIGAALNPDGDLLLYGCSVASGAGESFLSVLAQHTGADVAASENLTGSVALGGDWLLERTVGTVETAALQEAGYQYILPNAAPTITNLNGDSVAWAGVGQTVILDGGTALTVADTENDAAGTKWQGSSLTVKRVLSGVADATAKDVFGFSTSGASFTDTGSGALQLGGTTFATYTNSGGVLTINFTTAAATATVVQDVMRHVTYRNDTPYGTATIRFALNDGTDTSNADVTVTNTTIYVDASDTASTALSSVDNQGDAADGFTLYEALNKAVSGDTIKIVDGTYYGLFHAATGGITIEAANGASGNVTLAAPDTGVLVASSQQTMNTKDRYPILDLRTTTPDTDTITVRYLTFDGRYQALNTGSEHLLGIGIYNTNAVIDHVSIHRIVAPLEPGGYYSGMSTSFGILAEGSDTSAPVEVTIRNSVIDSFQKGGIAAWGPGLTATITDNSITMAGPFGKSNQNGIQIGSLGTRGGTRGTVSGNIISNSGSLDPDWASAGILTVTAGSGVIISNNTVNTDIAGMAGSYGSTVGIAVTHQLETIQVLNNTLINLEKGIAVESPWGTIGQYDGSHLFLGNNLDNTTYAIFDSQYGFLVASRGADANNDTITVHTSGVVANQYGALYYMLYAGNDSLTDTGSSPSYVDAGTGNDTISMGSGNDTIIGGDGNDVLTGGGGEDVFVIGDGDTVTDLTALADKLRVSGAVLTSAAMSLQDDGSDALLKIDTNNDSTPDVTIRLQGWQGLAVTSLTVAANGSDTDISINRPPTFTSTAVTSVDEDSRYTYTVSTNDVDGQVVTVTATTLPAWMTFSNGVLSGTPGMAEIGNHSVVLTATDAGGKTATQTFTVTVNYVDDAPIFTSSPPSSMTAGTGMRYVPTTTDEEGHAVTYTASNLPPWMDFSNGVLTGTPGRGEGGKNYTVTIVATDSGGASSSQTFTINIIAANKAPVFTSTPTGTADRGAGYSYTPATSDGDNDAVTVTATTLPSWLKFENGVLSGTPGNGDLGSHSVTLLASDGFGGTVTQSFTITVSGTNQAPVFSSTPPTTDTVGRTYSYAPAATDPEGKTVTFTATTLPSWLKFENGVLSGTPGSGDVGSHAVVLTATDADGVTLAQSFTITVGAVNQAPVFSSTPPTTDTVGTAYSYTPAATDPEGKTVTFTATTLPSWLKFENGVLSGTPGGGDVGSHTVVLTATDADGETLTQSFTITVSGTNQAPVFSSTPTTTDTVGTAYRYAPAATDPEGKAVTFSATTLPSWLKFENGVLSGTPGSGDVGSHTVVLTATDADGVTLTQRFTITVSAASTGTGTGTGTGSDGTTTVTTAPNINQLAPTTSTTVSTVSGTSTTDTVSSTAQGRSATSVTIMTGGAAGGSASFAPGGSDPGGNSPATVQVGNVAGNNSSATGIQQTQGLTSAVTSTDAGASADGSTLVRNAARGDTASTSNFYGAGTILSINSLGGGPLSGSGFGNSAAGGFGGGAGGFGASGLGGGIAGALAGFSATTGGTAGAGSAGAGLGGAGGVGANQGNTGPGGAGQGTGGPSAAPTGRTGGDGTGTGGTTGQAGPQGAQRSTGPAGNGTGGNAPSVGAPGTGGNVTGQPGQGNNRTAPNQNANPPSNQAPNQAPSEGTPVAPDQGGGNPAAAPVPGPQTGLAPAIGESWLAGLVDDHASSLPGPAFSDQLAHAHTAFDAQTARLAAVREAFRRVA